MGQENAEKIWGSLRVRATGQIWDLYPLNVLLPLLPWIPSQCLNLGTIDTIPSPKMGLSLISSPLLLPPSSSLQHLMSGTVTLISQFTSYYLLLHPNLPFFPNPILHIYLSTLPSGHPLSDHSRCQGYLYDVMMSSYSIMQLLVVSMQGVIILLIK